MSNILKYIKKYKDITFEKEKFNEIDNLILSELTYLNFDGIIPTDRNAITFNKAIKEYLKKYTYKETKKEGIAQKDAYKIIKILKDSKRYKNIQIYNYIYIGNKEMQFSAMVYKYKKEFTYIAFEGTDDLLIGWKEDFNIAYMFPTISQKAAIDYLNKAMSIFDKNVIVGGHSKGGNLALVASMYCKPLKRLKIKKIYNNDGPGLRLKEMNSKEYKKIKDRYIHIVPNYSYFGVLLRNDENDYKVVKSSRKDILAHSVLTWQINDKELATTNLSRISKNLEKSVITWLDDHNDNQRKKIINNVFKAVEDVGIDKLSSIARIKNIIKIVKNLKNIDQETKDLVVDFIKFNANYIIENRKLDESI